MADSDASLQILIQTLADTVGAEKVQAALDATTASTKKSGEAHAKASKEVEKHELSHRQLHRAMHAVDELVPGLGTAMQFSFGAAAGGVAVLIFAIQALHGWLEKIKEKYKEAGDASAAVWEAEYKRWTDAKTAIDDYAETQKRVVENVDKLKEAEERELAVLKAVETARKKILEAQEAAEIAAAKGDKVAEAEVHARYQRKKSAEELGAEADELATKESFLAAEREKAAQAEAKYAAAVNAKTEGPAGIFGPNGFAEAARASDWLQKHADDLKTAEAASKEAGNPDQLRDAANEYGNAPSFVFGPMGPTRTAAGAAREAAAKAEEAAHQLAQAGAMRQSMQGIVDAYNTDVARLDKAVEDAKSKKEAAQKQAADRAAEVDRDRVVLDVNKAAAGAISEDEASGELARAGFNPKAKSARAMLEAVRGEEARAHGEKMTAEQANTVRELTAVMRSHGASQETIRKLIEDLMNLSMSHEDKLRELAARVYGLSQSAGGRGLPGAS